MKRIGVVGTRERNERRDYKEVRDEFFILYKEGDWIVSGGCFKGGDHFAEEIAKKNGIPILIFYPNWDKYGKAAGFVRNSFIAEYSDVLIACVSCDRTGGTEDTIKKFEKLEKGKAILC